MYKYLKKRDAAKCVGGNLGLSRLDYGVSENLAVFHEWVVRQTQQCQDRSFDCEVIHV